VQANSPAAKAGLQPGDRILAVNGEEERTWEDVLEAVVYSQIRQRLVIDVERDGQRLSLTVPVRSGDVQSRPFGMSAEGAYTFIAGVEPGLPASRVGLQEGDVFVSINGAPIHTPQDVIDQVSASPQKPVEVIYKRGEKQMATLVTPTENGKIGILPAGQIPGDVETVHYGVFEALWVGIKGLVRITDIFLTNIWHIIIGEASFKQSIGGPVKIAEMAAQSAQAGLISFLSLMALLSISLAIINIFPIPALDGGHLMFLIFEGIFRREVPNKIKIAMQQVGMVLLLALMLFVIYNDIF
jgi:regulator of sigma E protease